jgi:hypothetical protein
VLLILLLVLYQMIDLFIKVLTGHTEVNLII